MGDYFKTWPRWAKIGGLVSVSFLVLVMLGILSPSAGEIVIFLLAGNAVGRMSIGFVDHGLDGIF